MSVTSVIEITNTISSYKNEIKKLGSKVGFQHRSIQYPVSSIQYPVSSIQNPVSSIQYPASSIQYPVSSIQHPVSSIQQPATAKKELKPETNPSPLNKMLRNINISFDGLANFTLDLSK
jgi:DNA-directed RNA polymerase II subunit RPB1